MLPRREDLERLPLSFFNRRGRGEAGNAGAGPIPITYYWVSDGDVDWSNPANWSTVSGGPGGAGVPTAGYDVVIDGGGSAVCTLTEASVCKEFSASAGGFSDGGFGLSCTDFSITSTTAMSLSGDHTISGDITLGAGTNVTWTGASSITTTGTPTITNSATNLPHMIHQDDASYVTSTTVARMQILNNSTITFTGGITFTVTAYTDTDWDGGTVTGAATWDLANPASMTVRDMTAQNSNATNEIDATDNCTDNGGNTNWTFVAAAVWKFNEATDKWNEANVKWNEAGA